MEPWWMFVMKIGLKRIPAVVPEWSFLVGSIQECLPKLIDKNQDTKRRRQAYFL